MAVQIVTKDDFIEFKKEVSLEVANTIIAFLKANFKEFQPRPNYLRNKQLKQIFKVSDATISKWNKNKKLKLYKALGLIYYKEEDIYSLFKLMDAEDYSNDENTSEDENNQ